MSATELIEEIQHLPEPERERIWRICVPPQAPAHADLDFRALSDLYPVAGGNIKNIALAAAMLAASEGQPIAMRHMAHGARREYQKIGKSFTDSDCFANGQLR